MNLSFNKLIFLPAAFAALMVGIIFPNLFVGLLITLGFGLYGLYKPKNALILLFLYFPIRPFLLEFNPSLKGVGDIIILFVLLKVLYENRRDWRHLLSFRWFELAFFAFCVLGAVSALFTGVSPVAIVFQIRAFLLLYFVYYIARRMEITKEDVAKLLWTVFLVAMMICIHGLIEKLSLRGLLLPQSWENRPLSAKNRIRIYGMIGNPNMLAFYLSFCFISIMYLRKFLSGKWFWVMNCGIVLLLSVWFMTYSRGTWIAFVIAMAIYMVLTRNWRVLRTYVISLAVAIVVISLPVNLITNMIEHTDFGQRQRQIQSQFDESQGSFTGRITGTFDSSFVEGSMRSGRLYIITKGFEIFPDHPVIGTGFGTFGDSATLSYGSPIYDDYGIEREFFSDNQYIQVIVQTGVIGVILIAVFLLNMLFNIWKKRKMSPLGPVLVSVLLGAYVAGNYYNVWEYDIFSLFYFAMLGYLLNFKFSKNVEL
ncbi:MAG TPA: O-antigen ligase family protein [Bacillales bacterium]|nr:O-antigen ligase family protein [Bacillales bacterium]